MTPRLWWLGIFGSILVVLGIAGAITDILPQVIRIQTIPLLMTGGIMLTLACFFLYQVASSELEHQMLGVLAALGAIFMVVGWVGDVTSFFPFRFTLEAIHLLGWGSLFLLTERIAQWAIRRTQRNQTSPAPAEEEPARESHPWHASQQ